MKAHILAFGIMLASAAAFAQISHAQTSHDGTITIEDPWARIEPHEDGAVSVFFDVLNTGTQDDELLSAYSSMAKNVVLRKGRWSGLNFFTKETEGIQIKDNRRVEFRPGAREVSLSGFETAPAVGQIIPLTLVFRHAGEVDIAPTVSNQLLGNRFRK